MQSTILFPPTVFQHKGNTQGWLLLRKHNIKFISYINYCQCPSENILQCISHHTDSSAPWNSYYMFLTLSCPSFLAWMCIQITSLVKSGLPPWIQPLASPLILLCSRRSASARSAARPALLADIDSKYSLYKLLFIFECCSSGTMKFTF